MYRIVLDNNRNEIEVDEKWYTRDKNKRYGLNHHTWLYHERVKVFDIKKDDLKDVESVNIEIPRKIKIVSSRGYFWIWIYKPKTKENVWTLWRTAYQMWASFIFVIWKRYKKQCYRETFRHQFLCLWNTSIK